jgi:hypothetical protein
MAVVVSALATLVGGYLAAGAVAKARSGRGSTDVLDHLASRWPALRRAGWRPVAAVEMGVAVAAAAPLATQQLGVVLQAVLLTAFVGLLWTARQAGVPCGCFGLERSRPSVTRLAFAVAAAAMAWAVAALTPEGPFALAGVVGGGLVGIAVAWPSGRGTRGADDDARQAGTTVTRRAAITRGIAAVGTMAGATLFGWQRAPMAGALTAGERTITPRAPLPDEVAEARASTHAAELLRVHGFDHERVAWARATAYDDRWADRTIVSLVAPIAGTATYLAYVGASPGVPEATAVLDDSVTGWVRIGEREYRLDEGDLVHGLEPLLIATSKDGELDFGECLTKYGGAVVSLCCAACGFGGPQIWGPCCGGCAIGTVIGCLLVTIR